MNIRNHFGSAIALLALLAAAPQAAQAFAATPPVSLAGWTGDGNFGTTPADGDITLSPQFGSEQFGYVSTADSLVFGTSPLVLVGEQAGSRMRSVAFSAAAGDTLSVAFNYVSTDGRDFSDYGWARLISADDHSLQPATVAWLFTARSGNSNTGKIIPGGITNGFDPDTAIVDFGNAFQFTERSTADPVSFAPLGTFNQTCFNDANGCGFTGWLESRHSFIASGSYRLEIGVVNFGDNDYHSALAFDLGALNVVASPVPEASTSAMLLVGSLLSIGTALRRRRRTPA